MTQTITREMISKNLATRKATNATTPFAQWMHTVDMIVTAKLGVSCDDLADCTYGDWYEDGFTASAAANKVIRNDQNGDSD